MKTSKYGFDGCMLSLTVWFVNIPHCSALKRFVFHFLNSLLGMTWYWWRWWFLTHVPASVSGRSFILYQIKEMIYISMIYMSKWGNASSSMPWDLFESLQTEQKFVCYEDSSGVPINPALVRQSNSLSLFYLSHPFIIIYPSINPLPYPFPLFWLLLVVKF